jgi:putative ABC transport system permease protein
MLSSFTNSTKKLEEGSGLNQSDVGTTNAVIEAAQADKNNLHTGSKITLLSAADQKTTISFTVVGIYQDTSKNIASASPAMDNGNQIYIPYTAVHELCGSGSKIDYAIYYMDDPINIDSFKSEASQIFKAGYTLDAQDADYRRMAGSLLNLTFNMQCYCLRYYNRSSHSLSYCYACIKG